jgi:hypothetical protein
MLICYFLINIVKNRENRQLVSGNSARSGFLIAGSNWKLILDPSAEKKLRPLGLSNAPL